MIDHPASNFATLSCSLEDFCSLTYFYPFSCADPFAWNFLSEQAAPLLHSTSNPSSKPTLPMKPNCALHPYSQVHPYSYSKHQIYVFLYLHQLMFSPCYLSLICCLLTMNFLDCKLLGGGAFLLVC